MAELIIAHAPEQRAEFTFNGLDPVESTFVSNMVGWRNFDRWASSVYEIHGRSLVFPSPSRNAISREDETMGRYGGLQIYGAGGSLNAVFGAADGQVEVKHGVTELPDSFAVYPVDPENHAEALEPILQQRKIDDQGQIHMWRRPYSPLFGMDKKEADRRREVTGKIWQEFENSRLQGNRTAVLVPEIAADGFFPDKLDPDGNPLRFQVYRVPLVMRLPNQFGRLTSTAGAEAGLTMLENASFLMGRFLRYLHLSGLAYMDDHIGNVSLLVSKGKSFLYATDLGSCEDIAEHPFKTRYHGFDFYSYIDSIYRLMTSYVPWIYKNGSTGATFEEIDAEFKTGGISGVMQGYYRSEIQSRMSEESSDDKIRTWIAGLTRQLKTGFETRGTQGFIEFFEGFDASVNNSRVG